MAEARAWTARRLIEALFFGIVALGMIKAARDFWYDRRFPERFIQVRLGMDSRAVPGLLGTPRWEGACAGRVRYLPREDCSRELGYSSAFAPIRPVHYIVQVDRSGKVIEAEPVRWR
ncbi:MAG TPA: hypothetical protein VE891_02735 [Allosphingosinicella sp.]|nr:hypothetical protein [Allosphingosinicella sp.]